MKINTRDLIFLKTYRSVWFYAKTMYNDAKNGSLINGVTVVGGVFISGIIAASYYSWLTLANRLSMIILHQ